MDDSPGNQNISSQISPVGTGVGITGKQNPEEHNQRPRYSIPGILHFIQHEWARFEMERAQWEVERAELQARIAFLQGERKGQENLKNDLIRRIKMLEYALKQERAKFHKLKYGTELSTVDLKGSVYEDLTKDEPVDGETFNSTLSWKQGRHLLRQYLQEIGYTDTIIDVRSSRVRNLLGLGPNNTESDEKKNTPMVNGEQSLKRVTDTQKRAPGKKATNSVTENALRETEASVLATFDFLSSDMEDEEEENLSDEEGCEPEDRIENKRIISKPVVIPSNNKMPRMDDLMMEDAETEEVLSEFSFLGPNSVNGSGEARSQGEIVDWGMQGGPLAFGASSRYLLMSSEGNEESMDTGLGLGELAGITVSNEAESNYDISASKEVFRKTWNAKYTLRSHFDGVRALAFHPEEPVLVTASEDHTLKLWNLQKTVPAKKAVSLDVEPIYTFRGHAGAVLCVTMNATGEQCFSGGLDSTIKCWNLPNSNIDPYDSYDPGILTTTLKGHSDAVWGLSIHSSKLQLLSCSADGTVRLWSPQIKAPLLHTYHAEKDDGHPASADFVRCDPAQMVVAYTSSNALIFDLETGKIVLRLDSNQTPSASPLSKQINHVVCHPTLPLAIAAYEDRHIRFFDTTTGKMVHSMVAHLDAVTCLAIDPNGLYLLSGSHDCSIRLWNMDNKTCVQEITSHRKKFDESIYDVAFHPSKPYIASAGADALAKVFV
ncbi:striatin-3-like isoform X9 [Tachypleus tridentatus]|uniref:striatin-3-like isoform X9 n=1 Tax=Tachypleus tridentatus TaxID=6853 RepID=UPI003FD3A94D